ncbi:MAG: hypothetical protein LBC07_05730 [Elusimicrobiota bacterium]|jgi:cytochrome b|nr:hypothetical protein [Elusimicrobiota bacterium]
MKNHRGQTFVEFALIFIVLFIVCTGVLNMYKNVWKNKYAKTALIGNAAASSIAGGYVK